MERGEEKDERLRKITIKHDRNILDISARVFEVFLIVLDGVRGETLWGGDPARATTLISESERQGNRQSSGQLSSGNA